MKHYDINEVKYIKWQWDVSHLVGITNHLHELNAEQQGTENWVISRSDNTKVFQINVRIYEIPIKTKKLVDSEFNLREWSIGLLFKCHAEKSGFLRPETGNRAQF